MHLQLSIQQLSWPGFIGEVSPLLSATPSCVDRFSSSVHIVKCPEIPNGRLLQTHQMHEWQPLTWIMLQVPSSNIHLNKHLSHVVQHQDYVTLHFADQSTADAKVVVGADGCFSKVRQQTLQDGLPEYTVSYFFVTLQQTTMCGLNASAMQLDLQQSAAHKPVDGGVRLNKSPAIVSSICVTGIFMNMISIAMCAKQAEAASVIQLASTQSHLLLAFPYRQVGSI